MSRSNSTVEKYELGGLLGIRRTPRCCEITNDNRQIDSILPNCAMRRP